MNSFELNNLTLMNSMNSQQITNYKQYADKSTNDLNNVDYNQDTDNIRAALFKLIKHNYDKQKLVNDGYYWDYYWDPIVQYPPIPQLIPSQQIYQSKQHQIDQQLNNINSISSELKSNASCFGRPKRFLGAMKSDRMNIFGSVLGFNGNATCKLPSNIINKSIISNVDNNLNYTLNYTKYATDLVGSKLNDYRQSELKNFDIDKSSISLIGDYTSSEGYVDEWFRKNASYLLVPPQDENGRILHYDLNDSLNISPDQQIDSLFTPESPKNASIDNLLVANNLSPSNANTVNILFNNMQQNDCNQAFTNSPSPSTLQKRLTSPVNIPNGVQQRVSYSQIVKSKVPINQTIVSNSVETAPSNSPLLPTPPTTNAGSPTPEEIFKQNEELSKENILFKSMCSNLIDHLYKLQNSVSSPESVQTPSSTLISPSAAAVGRNFVEKRINSPISEKLIKQARLHRVAANRADVRLTWTGELPDKTIRNAEYSTKVFLGGIPWDIKESDLARAFRKYGNIKLQWPGREVNCTARGEPARAGYVYCIFESQEKVKQLLSDCELKYDQTSGEAKWYWEISTVRKRNKPFEIKPWNTKDGSYVKRKVDGSKCKTLFVGALHGMITAKGLCNVIEEVFGSVVSVDIDTDKSKYPVGSARVTLSSGESFRNAVRTQFIHISSPSFNKKIQLDPYIESNAKCSRCKVKNGPVYCRDLLCLNYFCESCWEIVHDNDTKMKHPVIMKHRGCLLKDYLRELPSPLFAKALFEMMIDGVSVCLPDDAIGNAKLMFSILECLPKISRCTVLFLMDHLKAIVNNSERNKMNSQQIAIIFGPLFTCTDNDSFNLRKTIEVFRFLIDIWPSKKETSVLDSIKLNNQLNSQLSNNEFGTSNLIDKSNLMTSERRRLLNSELSLEREKERLRGDDSDLMNRSLIESNTMKKSTNHQFNSNQTNSQSSTNLNSLSGYNKPFSYHLPNNRDFNFTSNISSNNLNSNKSNAFNTSSLHNSTSAINSSLTNSLANSGITSTNISNLGIGQLNTNQLSTNTGSYNINQQQTMDSGLGSSGSANSGRNTGSSSNSTSRYSSSSTATAVKKNVGWSNQQENLSSPTSRNNSLISSSLIGNTSNTLLNNSLIGNTSTTGSSTKYSDYLSDKFTSNDKYSSTDKYKSNENDNYNSSRYNYSSSILDDSTRSNVMIGTGSLIGNLVDTSNSNSKYSSDLGESNKKSYDSYR